MCDGCFEIRKGSGQNIWKTVIERDATFESAMDLLVKDELCPSDAIVLNDFSKCKHDLLSDHGINLRKRIKLTQKYYREAEAAVEKRNLKGKPKFIHSTEKFSLNSMTYTRTIRISGMVCCAVF